MIVGPPSASRGLSVYLPSSAKLREDRGQTREGLRGFARLRVTVRALCRPPNRVRGAELWTLEVFDLQTRWAGRLWSFGGSLSAPITTLCCRFPLVLCGTTLCPRFDSLGSFMFAEEKQNCFPRPLQTLFGGITNAHLL